MATDEESPASSGEAAHSNPPSVGRDDVVRKTKMATGNRQIQKCFKTLRRKTSIRAKIIISCTGRKCRATCGHWCHLPDFVAPEYGHSREGGNPCCKPLGMRLPTYWIPAFAGMTGLRRSEEH